MLYRDDLFYNNPLLIKSASYNTYEISLLLSNNKNNTADIKVKI